MALQIVRQKRRAVPVLSAKRQDRPNRLRSADSVILGNFRLFLSSGFTMSGMAVTDFNSRLFAPERQGQILTLAGQNLEPFLGNKPIHLL